MTTAQPPPNQRVRWHAMADTAALHEDACARLLDAAALAIDERRRFVLVLSGGNTPQAIYRRLRSADADWPHWHVYFGDERCLPRDDPERNSAMAAGAWLDHVPIPSSQRHVIPAERGATTAADDYARELRDVGVFDLVLLGLGEDGHTASLFPGHDWGALENSPDALAVFDAPKPPPQRVTMSATRLSRTRSALFLIDGASKHDAVQAWRDGADIPAAAIRPRTGVDVLIDAALLTKRDLP